MRRLVWIVLTLLALFSVATPCLADVAVIANEAVKAQELGDIDRAMRLYSQVIDSGELKGPDDANLLSFLLNNRGVIWAGLGAFDRAIADYNRAIKIQEDASFFYNRGSAWFELGDATKALADLERAIQLKPGYTRAYRQRNLVLRSSGQPVAPVSSSLGLVFGIDAGELGLR